MMDFSLVELEVLLEGNARWRRDSNVYYLGYRRGDDDEELLGDVVDRCKKKLERLIEEKKILKRKEY